MQTFKECVIRFLNLLFNPHIKIPSLITKPLEMVEINSDFWKGQLFFRDYLRNNPKTSAEYQQLKENLVKQFQDDVFDYCEAKSAFIQKVLAKSSSNSGESTISNLPCLSYLSNKQDNKEEL